MDGPWARRGEDHAWTYGRLASRGRRPCPWAVASSEPAAADRRRRRGRSGPWTSRRSTIRRWSRPRVAGDRSAFDVLVRRHQRAIYAVCYRFAGNHADASDLAQDAFVRAYRGLARFKGDAAFGTWLYRIAVNVCLTRAAAKTPVDRSDRAARARRPARRSARRPLRRGAGRRPRQGRDRAAAREAAADGDPARVPRAAARGDCPEAGQHRRHGEGELLPRAAESAQAARGAHVMSHLSRDERLLALDGALERDARTGTSASCAACRADVETLRRRRWRGSGPSTCRSRRRCSGITWRRASATPSRASRRRCRHRRLVVAASGLGGGRHARRRRRARG